MAQEVMTQSGNFPIQLYDNKPFIDIQQQEGFLKSINTKPEKTESPQGFETIPISALENDLDEVFMGLWETTNFRYTVIANEITGVLELRVFHPTARVWLTRTGMASVMIRQHKDAMLTDISAKIKNGLAMDFPKLHSMCLKAAAKTFGKKFGRDLNRKYEDDYETVYTDQIQLESVVDGLKADLNQCTNVDEIMKVWNEYTDLHENTAAKKLFRSYKTRLTLKTKAA
jgi:hypothetical protein